MFTIVNNSVFAMVKAGILIFVLCAGLVAQQPSELERRVQELEEQVRKMKEAATPPAPPEPKPEPEPEPEPVATAPPVVVSVEDGIAGPNREIRLPVSGYMDFHVNKDRAIPSGPISIASCSCSAIASRIASSSGANSSWNTRWWKAREESGEVALEQAYLDFLITAEVQPARRYGADARRHRQ